MKHIRIILAVTLAILSIDINAQTNDTKTFSIIGDSYSTFKEYIPDGYISWYSTTARKDNDVTSVEETWWYMFAKENGYKLLLNESFSGTTICNTGYKGVDYSEKSFIKRMYKVTSDIPDLIIIFGATNDSWANSPIGELKYENWTPSDLYSFLPACCFMLDHLTTVAKDSQIIFIINTELKEEITNGIIEACRHYGVQSLQLKDIEKKSSHPSIKGMAQICAQLTDFLK